MFKKAFTVKSNSNVKNSDRRKLLQRLPEETANNIPKKAAVAHAQITTFTNAQVNVYTYDKIPLLFDFDQKTSVFPTVYATWTDPGFCPMLIVHEQVMKFLENGADLMLPGVIRSESIPFPQFERGCPIAVSLLQRDGKIIGPVAIGCALLSSDQMIKCDMQGKGVQMIHVYRDTLWEFGPKTHPPFVDYAAIVAAASAPVSQEIEGLNLEEEDKQDEGLLEGKVAIPDSAPEEENLEIGTEEEGCAEPMEDLLHRCFLAGLRYRLGKSATLPFDVGQFYSHCLLKCVPENRRLDVKKTKYKKFAIFLTEINKGSGGPILKITTKGKGVDVISEVNWAHPSLTSFKVTDERTTDEVPKNAILGPKITEYLSITDAVLPLVKAVCSASKGNLLQSSDVREIVTEYVKKENLNASKSVRLDPLLSGVAGIKEECVDWNTLMQKIVGRMTKTYVMVLPDGKELMRKVKMPKIVFKIETRSGNKKVTLVNNLSSFGLEPKEIAHKTQVGVAASATLGDAPNCEGQQMIVQGNQVVFVGDLLMKTYGIDKKYIEGLDLAPKKKK